MTIVVAIMASVFIFMGSQICIVNNRINQTPIQTIEAVVHEKEIIKETRTESSATSRIETQQIHIKFITYFVTENEKDGIEIHSVDDGEIYENFKVGDKVILEYKQIRKTKVIIRIRKIE